MIYGTYRRLTPEELKPIEGRPWIGFGGTKGVKFVLEGVEWRIPGHPEPIVIIFQDRVSEEGDGVISDLAYTHIPYPQRLLPATRERLADMLMHVDKTAFMEKLEELALENNK